MTRWKDLQKQLLDDPKVKKEYDLLVPRYEIISQMIDARLKRGFTQKDVAERLGTKQSAIARLESGSVNPSLEFLQRFAQAMGLKLNIYLSK